MKWFRSRVRFGSQLALLALAIHLLLSFGHFHGSAQAASVSADAKRSGLGDAIGFAVAHLRALDSLSHANASGPVRLKPAGEVPAPEPDQDCAICAAMALAAAMVDATPPCLLGPQAVAFLYLDATAAEFVDRNPVRGAFEPRAPPIS
jgi:hypothetical protein